MLNKKPSDKSISNWWFEVGLLL